MTTTITPQQAQARGYNLTEPVTIFFKAPSRNIPDPNSSEVWRVVHAVVEFRLAMAAVNEVQSFISKDGPGTHKVMSEQRGKDWDEANTRLQKVFQETGMLA